MSQSSFISKLLQFNNPKIIINYVFFPTFIVRFFDRQCARHFAARHFVRKIILLDLFFRSYFILLKIEVFVLFHRMR
jgi:hypothetical protein